MAIPTKVLFTIVKPSQAARSGELGSRTPQPGESVVVKRKSFESSEEERVLARMLLWPARLMLSEPVLWTAHADLEDWFCTSWSTSLSSSPVSSASSASSSPAKSAEEAEPAPLPCCSSSSSGGKHHPCVLLLLPGLSAIASLPRGKNQACRMEDSNDGIGSEMLTAGMVAGALQSELARAFWIRVVMPAAESDCDAAGVEKLLGRAPGNTEKQLEMEQRSCRGSGITADGVSAPGSGDRPVSPGEEGPPAVWDGPTSGPTKEDLPVAGPKLEEGLEPPELLELAKEGPREGGKPYHAGSRRRVVRCMRPSSCAGHSGGETPTGASASCGGHSGAKGPRGEGTCVSVMRRDCCCCCRSSSSSLGWCLPTMASWSLARESMTGSNCLRRSGSRTASKAAVPTSGNRPTVSPNRRSTSATRPSSALQQAPPSLRPPPVAPAAAMPFAAPMASAAPTAPAAPRSSRLAIAIAHSSGGKGKRRRSHMQSPRVHRDARAGKGAAVALA
mmetsp:Transcript_103551/g.221464  ORF Transcript_103551/g.221464 Transcript_103551/m.221464 type:complete len:503 (-) Transcript_103551:2-1510(-)